MKRRRPHPPVLALAVALAVAFVTLARPPFAFADAVTTKTVNYELTSDSTIPDAEGQDYANAFQAIFQFTPKDAIIPPPSKSDPTKTDSPLTLLNTSKGVDPDPNNLALGMKSVTNSDGTTKQLFGLSFFGQGLKSAADGGKVDFSLNLNAALPSPTFTLDDTSAFKGLHLTELLPPPPPPTTPADTGTTTTTTTTATDGGASNAQVPEPASLALWSALAVAGLLRARSVRIRRLASARAA